LIYYQPPSKVTPRAKFALSAEFANRLVEAHERRERNDETVKSSEVDFRPEAG
jgi:hypothetical protein